ncbi:MAG: 3-deoxy-manno-octulosonate cytidylyltransferase [Bacteroidota bacterium]|nr:3-deoxy-manno-octulosonate cytidylyltransferase [Bacteroidota bacterium]
MMEQILIVIPARYASTRFPGKPLAMIAGKSMIQRVWERCGAATCSSRVVVATDDERIRDEVLRFGGEVFMTPSGITSGTERIACLAAQEHADIYVNVQGDEPLLPPFTIDATVSALRENPGADIATASCPLAGEEGISSPDTVKLVTDAAGFALYFSRAGIPYQRHDGNASPRDGVYRKHIGIYVYRRAALLRFSALPPSPLEQAERLEQLRALENGMRIVVANVPADSQAVDVPDDVRRVEALLRNTDKTSSN